MAAAGHRTLGEVVRQASYAETAVAAHAHHPGLH